MKNPSIKQVLKDPNKMMGESQNLLSRLLRQLAYELQIGPRSFANLMSRYLADPKMGVANSDNPNARINHKGNMVKEFGSPKISWQVFEKWLRVLRVKRARLILQIEREGGTVTQHEILFHNDLTEDNDLSKAKVLSEFPENANDLLPTDVEMPGQNKS